MNGGWKKDFAKIGNPFCKESKGSAAVWKVEDFVGYAMSEGMVSVLENGLAGCAMLDKRCPVFWSGYILSKYCRPCFYWNCCSTV